MLCSIFEKIECFEIIFCYAAPLTIQESEMKLSRGKTFCSSFFIPLKRLAIVLWNIFAMVVRKTEIVL